MEITVIESKQVLGQEVKVYGDKDNPLFLAKEVANWIDYSTDKVGQMLIGVDVDEKITSPIFYSGQVREMWFVTEDGLYEILMQSRKPVAKEFKKEVKKILKTIRKTGGYVQQDRAIDFVNTWLPQINDTAKSIIAETLESNRKLVVENKQLVTTVETLTPSANAWDTVKQCEGSIQLGPFANTLTSNGIKELYVNGCFIKNGSKNIFKWFKANKYIKNNNIPYQKYIDNGYFKTFEKPVNGFINVITTITPKGQEIIINQILQELKMLG